MNIYKLTDDEKDLLQELMNIAYGNATSIIASMMDAFASLSIPNITIMPVPQLIKSFEKLKISNYFFTSQIFTGQFSGESAFFISLQSAKNLATHLKVEDEHELDDVILELTNILTSSLISRLAQEMQTEVDFSPPKLLNINICHTNSVNSFKKFSQVIVIETQMNFKEQEIHGQIFILTQDESITWLKQKINTIINNLI
ncbi:chemotaxis protein CheC [Sulfurimonas aquatica]|uniref:Chemotaxis protein CheC n=1 Tax=Sulfurimonas aquatica TaxID=2672570 RepID=A0A975B2P8_9BACT|nr:chemotaxis protein CheC [Sulfurimonas aquatica]QSZ43023.1 chemotaxis protein CheC [Sulfurimonas aquatica]